MKEIDIKVILKLIIVISLIIPIFFGFNFNYLLIRDLSVYSLIVISIGLIGLFLLGYYIINHIFDEKLFNVFKSHEVVVSLQKRDYSFLYQSFLITMTMEELIFRFYINGLLFNYTSFLFALILSSLIFSLYHFHVLLIYKNKKLFLINSVYSFFLGLLNGYVFYYIGFIPCIAIHYFYVLHFYYKLFKKFGFENKY